MNHPSAEAAEVFLQEASEHLQYLREYSGMLQEAQSRPEDLEKLYAAANTLAGTSANYDFPQFAEIAAKMAHIFHYALNATLTAEMLGPLTEFVSDAISVMEFDLLHISSTGFETTSDIEAFKLRYSFAFPAPPSAEGAPEVHSSTSDGLGSDDPGSGDSGSYDPGSYDSSVAEPADGSDPIPSMAAELPEDAQVPGEILEFFLPEAEEHLQAVTECLLALEGNPNPEDINRLFRAMHTVKGSAAQVGLHRLAAVAHHVEDLIGHLREGALKPSAEIVDLCLQSVDILKKFLHQQWSSDEEMYAAVHPLLARIAELAPNGSEGESAAENHPETVAQEAEAPTAIADPAVSAPQPTTLQALPQAKSVRIALDRLDRMMNAVGELVVNRTRMVGRLSELSQLVEILTFSKGRLVNKVSEFQEKHEFNRISLRPESRPSQQPIGTFGRHSRPQPATIFDNLPEFSDLEMDRYDDFNILSRSLTEISADVTEVLAQLEGFMGRVDSDIDEFTKLAHHLQDEITAARMVPIGNLYTRLSRTARDAAKAVNKPIEMLLEGADTELDNNIIQHISDPLIHLVRNSIAHGIENADARRDAGKPEKGQISVRAYHRGNHIFIEVEDDGRGIDYDQIRQSVTASRSMSSAAVEALSEAELREFLFQPGFSTASSMSELAGRGVGLDVVRSNIHALNGEIEVQSERRRGARFTLKVPLTLIISQALFVRCGTSVFAFPLAVVEEIRRLRPSEIEDVGGKLLTRVRDVVTEVVRLDTQLGLAPFDPVNGYFHMVLVKVAGKQTGVIVETVIGKDEIVIKNLGDYLQRVKLFPGTTIASDGSLILLIDLNRLVSAETSQRRAIHSASPASRVFGPGAEAVAAGSIPPEAIDDVGSERVVVVADDSISVRKFVGRMIGRAGYRVKLAADGLEAAEMIAQFGCNLLVTDLEMPLMNGYELMAQLRQSPETREIPVLVVTSRAGAKHRDRAIKEGASGFLTKPVQEDQLLSEIEKLLGARSIHDERDLGVPLRQG